MSSLKKKVRKQGGVETTKVARLLFSPDIDSFPADSVSETFFVSETLCSLGAQICDHLLHDVMTTHSLVTSQSFMPLTKIVSEFKFNDRCIEVKVPKKSQSQKEEQM